MAQRAPAKSTRRRTGRPESITDLAKDLELLRVAEEDGTKSSMARVRDSRIEELKRTNGTLQEVGFSDVKKLFISYHKHFQNSYKFRLDNSGS